MGRLLPSLSVLVLAFVLVGCSRRVPSGSSEPENIVLAEPSPGTGTSRVAREQAPAPRLIPIFQGHTKPVMCVDLSPDGSHLISASEDGTIRLWDARTGREVRPFTGATSGIAFIRFSPDGTRVLTGRIPQTRRENEAAPLSIWDVETGQEVKAFPAIPRQVVSAALSPDGKKLLVAVGAGLQMWDVETGKQLWTAPLVPYGEKSVAFVAWEREVVSSDTVAVHRHDAETGVELTQFGGGQGIDLQRVVFSANGRWALGSAGLRGTRAWAIPKAVQVMTWPGPRPAVPDEEGGFLAMREPNGEYRVSFPAALSRDGTLALIIVTRRRVLEEAEFPDPRAGDPRRPTDPNCPEFNTLLLETTASVWELGTGRETRVPFPQERGAFEAYFFQGDSPMTVFGDRAGTLKLRNLAP